MRSLFLAFIVGTFSYMLAFPAGAQDTTSSQVVACMFPMCGGIQDGLVASLAEQGLSEVDGLAYDVDASGQGWLTVVSTDARGLAGIDPTGKATVLPIRGTVSYAVTVPAVMGGLVVGSGTGPLEGSMDFILEIDGVRGETGDGGSGGGDDDCYACVCTEDGYECDYIC